MINPENAAKNLPVGHTKAQIMGEIDKAEQANDSVNSPSHYKVGGIETIDFIEAKQLGYHLGNVVKYVSRAGHKAPNPLRDVQKAKWYLDRYVEELEKQAGLR